MAACLYRSVLSLGLIGMLVAMATAADACNQTQCTDGQLCVGFGKEICVNSTSNESYLGAVCYTTSHCNSYGAQDTDIVLTLTGVSPKLIYDYYGFIQAAIVDFYNKFCWASDNFKLCCPGAVTGPTTPANFPAMTNATAEVPILSAYGSSSRAVLAIRLVPSTDSPLCQNVTYQQPTTPTTAAATTTAAEAAATTTTMNGNTGGTGTAATAATGTEATPGTGGGSTPSEPMLSSSMAPSMASTPMMTPTVESSMPMTASMMPPSTMESSPVMTSPQMESSTPMTSAPMSSPPMDTTMPTESITTSSGTRRRRRRDLLDAEERSGEDQAEDFDGLLLSRQRRAAAAIVSLPASTIANITSGNFTGEIQAALANQNVTVTVAVSLASTATTTVMSTTQKSAASQRPGVTGQMAIFLSSLLAFILLLNMVV